MKYIKIKKQQAFISIFAIFFSAIVVSILTALYILLIRQIEILNMDTSSFQSIYMADSAFECALYKEQTATGTNSVFLPSHSGSLGNCVVDGDATWESAPTVTSSRAKSVLNISMNSSAGSFCGIVTVGKQTNNSEVSNSMTISGQSRECSASTSTKVVERLIEFRY
jgi:hypothetical protein